MSRMWQGWRSIVTNGAASQAKDGMDYIRDVAETVIGLISEYDVEIPENDISTLTLPTVDWNTLDMGAAMSYFNDIYNQFMTAPPSDVVDLPDIPNVQVPDVVTVYDPEPLATVKGKVLSDVSNATFGIETVDKSRIQGRARERALSSASSLSSGLLSLHSTGGIYVPPAVVQAMAGVAARTSQGAVASSERSVAISDSEAWWLGKKAERKIGIDTYEIIFKEYAEKIESIMTVFAARIEGYTKRTEAQIVPIGLAYKNYISRVGAYAAMVEAMMAAFEMSAKNIDTSGGIYKERVGLASERAKLELKKFLGMIEASMDGGKAKLAAYAGIGASALSALNVNASVSDDYNESESNDARTSSSASAEVSARNSAGVEIDIFPDTYTGNPGASVPSI